MRFIVEDLSSDAALTLRTARPGNGIGAWFRKIEGWLGTPAPREEPVERYLSDGDLMPSSLTQGARIVTIQGAQRFRSSMKSADFRDLLCSLACKQVRITEDGPNGRRSSVGYVSDEIEPTFHEAGLLLEFDLIVTCPDPLKYGDEHRIVLSNGSHTINNIGNAPTWPAFRLEPATGETVHRLIATRGSQTVRWEGSASTLDLDFRDMDPHYSTSFIGPQTGAVSLDNAWQLAPGKQTVSISSDAAKTELILRPAWR